MELKVIEEEARYRLITDGRPEDIAGDGTCAVAVAAMVHRSDERVFEVVEMLQRTEKCNSQCFLADPSFAEETDIIQIGLAVVEL